MTTSNSERCQKCGQLKTASKSGSLTQWINVCGCDNLESVPDTAFEPIQFCAICAKRITKERKGSLTQFIFRSDVCKCEHPRVADDTESEEMAERIAEATKIDLGPIKKELTAEEIEQLASEFSLAVEKFPFERYSPVKVIGEGASGVVYLASDRYLKKQVAIKCLQRLEPAQLVGFQNEARATSKLSHEGIVTVFDFGATTAGVPYMVMEFVDGISLFQHLAKNKTLTPLQAARVVSKVAEALSRAHYQSVFHRDVKPSNMILCGDALRPDVKIIDFGVAQLRPDDDSGVINVNGHSLVGTPAYMAPELSSGGEFTPLAEIYSVGCLLFQCLTGRVPFESENPLVSIRRHKNEAPPLVSDLAPDVPLQLEEIVSKCLEKDPADRFQSMQELADSLREIAEQIHEDDLNSQKVAAENLISDAALAAKVALEQQSSVSSLATERAKATKRNWAIASVLVIGVFVYFASDYLKQTSNNVKSGKSEVTPTVPEKVPDEINNETNYLDVTFDAIDFDGRLISEGKGTVERIKEFCKKHKSANTILIRSDELTDKELPLLAKLEPSLFSLSKCTSLTDKGFLQFDKLKSINNLTLDENPQITPQGYKNLSVIPHLRELSVKNCDLDTEDIKALSTIKDLFNLDIRNNPRVTMESLEEFQPRPANMLLLIAGCAADKASPAEKRKFELKHNITLSSAK